MKALILSAGFGSRLLPYSQRVPKPLFTLDRQTILSINIEKLIKSGCDHILINTHYLADQIRNFVQLYIKHHNVCKNGSVKIEIIYEPQILETGGAIANIASIIDRQPFFVVNSDIVSDIDLNAVYQGHIVSDALATLVLHNYLQFNKVSLDEHGRITGFDSFDNGLAFTGIQILSPAILEYFPIGKSYSSVSVYSFLCKNGIYLRAHVENTPYWRDIGTCNNYQNMAREWIAAKALGFNLIYPPEHGRKFIKDLHINQLVGDGSDRKWFRACCSKLPSRSVIISHYGICPDSSDALSQLRAFVFIGNHLFDIGIPVPKILAYDEMSGMVALEDFGNYHLKDLVDNAKSSTNEENLILEIYKQVVDKAIDFSQKGIKKFNLKWTFQTSHYSKELILEKECRYFVEFFLQAFLGKDIDYQDFEADFNFIADQALKFSFEGLMHRDMQSRNIMIRNGLIYFIDFQSARIGPFQYDLASLLMDPYVALSPVVKNRLITYALDRIFPNMGSKSQEKRNNFLHSFQFCCMTRNLQFLGAFAFLSLIKGKKQFESYIPHGLNSLKALISEMNYDSVQTLKHFIDTI